MKKKVQNISVKTITVKKHVGDVNNDIDDGFCVILSLVFVQGKIEIIQDDI